MACELPVAVVVSPQVTRPPLPLPSLSPGRLWLWSLLHRSSLPLLRFSSGRLWLWSLVHRSSPPLLLFQCTCNALHDAAHSLRAVVGTHVGVWAMLRAGAIRVFLLLLLLLEVMLRDTRLHYGFLPPSACGCTGAPPHAACVLHRLLAVAATAWSRVRRPMRGSTACGLWLLVPFHTSTSLRYGRMP